MRAAVRQKPSAHFIGSASVLVLRVLRNETPALTRLADEIRCMRTPNSNRSVEVAIIGAGAAGLAAARDLHLAGYQVVGEAEAASALARPVGGRLFFAGEATDTEGATGTVHGAIASGRRAARQVKRALNRRRRRH